ncbi:MAG: MFS transporter, partial [Rhodococcus sp. (in: high G+C Gram-positive bacteria)]
MNQPPHAPTEAFLVDDARLLPFHKRLALHAGGGPFLDGYVLSIIGIAT